MQNVSRLIFLPITSLILLTACAPAPRLLPSTPTAASTQTSTSAPAVTATLTLTPAPTHEPGAWTSTVDGMEMMYVPQGPFTMGRTLDGAMQECQRHYFGCQESFFANEEPPHTVYLDSFWIGETEVTNIMYARCVEAWACRAPSAFTADNRDSYYGNPAYDDYPVVYVDWGQAGAYCSWAGLRLPTEAEWEKAARGTDGRTYPWGSASPNCWLANFMPPDGMTCILGTRTVGLMPAGASPSGALDMAGNVWEWVNDWYGEDYYSQSPADNPVGPSSGFARVVRGGSWASFGFYVWTTYRSPRAPADSDDELGFRCAASP